MQPESCGFSSWQWLPSISENCRLNLDSSLFFVRTYPFFTFWLLYSCALPVTFGEEVRQNFLHLMFQSKFSGNQNSRLKSVPTSYVRGRLVIQLGTELITSVNLLNLPSRGDYGSNTATCTCWQSGHIAGLQLN